MMYGQMTAGSWIYIGSQGIVQGTYETFAEAGRRHYGGDLAGRWILTGGLGGMGGAQPLAATMAGASCLAVECRRSRIERRIETRYLDRLAETLDEALAMIDEAGRGRRALSVGLVGNAAEVFAEIFRRGVRPDIVTDQTSAHDPLHGYLPIGWDVATWEERQATDAARRRASCQGVHGGACPRHARLPPCGRAHPRLRQQHPPVRARRWASRMRSISRASCRPTSDRSSAPVAGRSAGQRSPAIPRTSGRPTPRSRSCSRDDRHLHRWLDMARERIAFQGLPARICWLGLGERAKAGLAFNAMVANGELEAPVVIGRDHLDSGSVASPNRETEAMRDGSDAVADWPLLNALLNCASGATWVSLHHGGGVGIGYSQHSGMVIVCDGTAEAARRLERVLTNDPATGVMRHADAGYPEAIACAREQGLNLPMLA